MTAKKRWYAARGHPRGLSTGVGMVGGLILVTTGLTGGLAAAQLVRVHAVLAQAAHAAAQSEQQQGCWTESTTQVVYQTLKEAGVNPGSVALTADTAQSTLYGGRVTAGLTTKVGVSVLGAQWLQIPVSAAANAPSFYTPTTAGGTNPACITPATCPTVTTDHQQCTPAHQSCQAATTEVCTPVSQQVCGPVTTTNCGDTTQEEYTCAPQQFCQTNYWDCSDPGTASCPPADWVTTCTTQEECHDQPVTVYQCHDVTTNTCRTMTTESCHPITQEQCRTIPEQCTTVPETVSACG
uniref:Uncharacterized protein n=2 Tax=Sulfobacillus thermotolerans TaxID=338644 RepID=G5CIZ9_9FIRM|nr:hypothetical protein [Sulfobacillus thermotolerans]